MRALVIGAGLGGLLSGLLLLKKGYDATIFESLGYPGGRFTNREYKGYQLSTGALHMIPHGRRGPLGKLLRDHGVGVEVITSKPEGFFRVMGRDYLYEELPGLFSLADKVRLSALLAKLTLGRGGKGSFKEWIQGHMKNELVLRLADSFCGWALSIDSSQISAGELMAITKNVDKLGGPGVPVGGCKGVAEALMEGIEGEGGKLMLRSRVKKIGVENGRAVYAATNNEKYPCDLIVSDIGPKATIKLCGEENFPENYVEKIMGIQEAGGVKISVACDKAMLGHSGVLFTPEARRIDGLNEVTNADSGLAPGGKHLLMSHQALAPGDDVRKEIQLGLKDLHNIFPDFKENCHVIAAQCYRGRWPVNRARSGVEISPETPVRGLYVVGDAVKPKGFMETEGIAAGVEKAVRAMTG